MTDRVTNERALAIADVVVPNYRKGKRLPSCTSHTAKCWNAAYDGAVRGLNTAQPATTMPAQLPAVIEPEPEPELGFSATTLKNLLIERAGVDRQQTVQAMVEALAQLDVIRPVRSAQVYDHRLIGAHQHNREMIADQIGRFLFANDVIEFAQRADIAGGRGMTAVTGEVWVMIPKRLQGTEPEPGTEVVN